VYQKNGDVITLPGNASHKRVGLTTMKPHVKQATRVWFVRQVLILLLVLEVRAGVTVLNIQRKIVVTLVIIHVPVKITGVVDTWAAGEVQIQMLTHVDPNLNGMADAAHHGTLIIKIIATMFFMLHLVRISVLAVATYNVQIQRDVPPLQKSILNTHQVAYCLMEAK
jgi:hypothetical protein